MAAAKRVGVELDEEQIHLIAKALADPRRYELLRQIGSCNAPMECADIRGVPTGERGDIVAPYEGVGDWPG